MKRISLFTDFLTKIVIVFVGGLFLVSIIGCGRKEQRTLFGTAAPKHEQISKEELREELSNFEEFAIAAIAESTTKLDALSPDLRSRKISLVQRTRLRHAFHTMLEQDEPIIAFLETWALCVRLTDYFEHGEGIMLYGKNQEIATATAEKLQDEIEIIGRRLLKEDSFITTRQKVYNFAKTNPIRGTFSNTIIFATKVEPGKPGLFEDVVSIPMSPFKAMSGVDRTASAIYGVRDSVDRFTDVVEEFSEATRWQMLLLLMEMEETEMVKSFLASSAKLSESSARLATFLENFPEELSNLITEIDEKQANLQTTLEKAEKTSVSIEKAFLQADKTVASFQATANDINQTAASWEKAAIATTDTLTNFKTLFPKRKDTDPKPGFNMNDLQSSIEAAGQAVSEMRELTDGLHELVKSEQLNQYVSMPNDLTNLLAKRLGQLIVLIFTLALVYRFAVIRILKKPAQKS